MLFAIITNTPITHAWDIGLGVIIRYLRRTERILPLINPFAVQPKEEEITDPKMIRAWAKSVGIKEA